MAGRLKELIVAVVLVLGLWCAGILVNPAMSSPQMNEGRDCCPASLQQVVKGDGERLDCPVTTAVDLSTTLSTLDLGPGDRLVLYRNSQPYYHQTQLPHEWMIVKSITTPAFFQVIGDPQQDQFVSSMLWDGWYEGPLSETMLHLFKECDPKAKRFLDVGMNLGWFSLLAASQGYEVASFEPQTRLVQMVRHSVTLNNYGSRIHIHNGPVGPDDETVVLHEASGNWGGASVKAAADGAQNGMKTISLDTAMSLLDKGMWAHGEKPLYPGAPICFMKVDVEGFEPEVFANAPATLGITQYVVIEFRRNNSGYSAVKHLVDNGFNRFLIMDDLCCKDRASPFLSSGEVTDSIEKIVAKMSHVSQDSYVNLLLYRA